MSRSLDLALPWRRLTATLALVGLLTLLVLAGSGRAEAHSDLESSEPGEGQVLAAPPRELVLRFTEPVSVHLAEIHLQGPDGRDVRLGSPGHPPRDETTVAVPVREKVGPGGFTLDYRLVSADSHPLSGTIRFSVAPAQQAAPATLEPAGPTLRTSVPPRPASDDADTLAALAGLARWGGYVGLALLVGPTALLALAWPQGAAVRRVRLLIGSGWAGAAGCTLLGLVTFGPHALGLPLRSVVDPDVLAGTLSERAGQALAARLVLLGAVGVALVRLSRDPWPDDATRSSRTAGPLVLVWGAALASTYSLTTHNAVGAQAPLALAVDIVHLVAMAVWIGGLALVLLAILPARDLPTMRAVLPVFSRAAAICVAALALTGAFQAWRQTRSVAALLETSYGELLIGKLALASLLVALGALARHWLTRRLLGAREAAAAVLLHRTVLAEAGVAVAVLALSSLLVTTEPARMAYAADLRTGPPGQAATSPEAARAADPSRGGVGQATAVPAAVPFDAHGGPRERGQVMMLLEPARVGRTSLHVAVQDATGAPGRVRRAALALVPAGGGQAVGVDLLDGGPGHFAGLVTVPAAGAWKAVMVLGFRGGRTATVAYPLQVAP